MGILSEDYINRFYKLSGVIVEQRITSLSAGDEFVISDKYINDYLSSMGGDFALSDYLNDVIGINYEEDGYQEAAGIAQNSPEFREYVKEKIIKEFEEFKNGISKYINPNSNILKIYRSITVKQGWEEHLRSQGKHLGVYWSWSPEGGGVIGEGGDKPYEVRLCAEVDMKYIDWESTIHQNIELGTEEEISLFKGTPLKLINISKNSIERADGDDLDAHFAKEKEIDPSFYQGKIFYA